MGMLKYARNYGITCNSTKNIPIHPLGKIDSSKPAEFAVHWAAWAGGHRHPSATTAARRTNAAHTHTHYTLWQYGVWSFQTG